MKKTLFYFAVALSALTMTVASCGKDDDKPEVTGISLDKTMLALAVDENYKLTATVTPENADNTVTWTSSDITKAAVYDGTVFALAVGEVTITATAGNRTAICTVIISPTVNNISLDKVTLTLVIDEEYPLVATITPDNASKTVTWTSSAEAIATVTDGKVTAITTGTATITAKAGDRTATCLVTVKNNPLIDKGVVINGIKWATRNVDKPGTFANKPEDRGMLYQWNRNIGWSNSHPMVNSNGGTEWDNSISTGNTWETSNNVCPTGWRIPTIEELQSLFEANNEWIESTPRGRKFGSGNNIIFLPTAGSRDGSDGTLWSSNMNGIYRSSTINESNNMRSHALVFTSSVLEISNNVNHNFGYSVRCVADE
jgi:uncharacterized protein (TIGR02145 family)